jgi:hypothetical protein
VAIEALSSIYSSYNLLVLLILHLLLFLLLLLLRPTAVTCRPRKRTGPGERGCTTQARRGIKKRGQQQVEDGRAVGSNRS